MYGQKYNLRPKVFINTLCTKSNNSIPKYHQILLLVCVLTFQTIAPPPSSPIVSLTTLIGQERSYLHISTISKINQFRELISKSN